MISKIKKPVSILLSLIMVFSVFAIVPLSASAAYWYSDLARGTLIQPEDTFSFDEIGSFKFADYNDPTIIHEVKGSDFSYNQATLSVTDGYYSFGSTKLLPTSVSPGGLLIADYDSTTKMATFGVQNITHSFDSTTGTLTIGGSGVVPPNYAFTGSDVYDVVFTQSNLVKHLIIDATDMIAIKQDAFMAYTGGCVLEDVEINSTSSTPLIIEENAVFYGSDNTVTITVNAVKLATVTNSPVNNYGSPVNLIYNVEQPITFKKNALTEPWRDLTVTFPAGCKIFIPGGPQFTDSHLQEDYDMFAEDGMEEFFWDMHPDLVEGTDYVLGDARYEELTPLNASLVVGNDNTALFSAYTITDESVNGTVTASVNGTDVTEAAADADVLLTVAPDNGYQFKSISATYPKNKVEEFSDLVALMGDAVFSAADYADHPEYTCKVNDGKFVVYDGDTSVAELSEANMTNAELGSTYFSAQCGGLNWNLYLRDGIITDIYVYDSDYNYIFSSADGSKSTGTLLPAVVNLTTVTEGSQYSLTMPKMPVTVTAEFEEAPTPTYTVTWKNGDTVLETDENVAAGATPTYDGETPYKADGADCIYTFSGWTPEVSAVTGDATYTAQFTESEKPETIKDCNNKYGNFRLYSNVPIVSFSNVNDLLTGAIIPITYGDTNTMIPVQDAKGYTYKFYDQTGTEIPFEITDSSSAPGSDYELSDDVTVYTNVINFTRPAGCTAIYIVATAPAPAPEGINYGGDNYIDPKGTQEVSSSDEGKTKFGLNLGSYLNMQMLGIQLKNSIATEGGDDGVRFVTAVNSNLLKGSNIEDYGYIVAKINSDVTTLYEKMDKFTAEKFIAQGAADTNIFSCKGSSNSISGEFGKYSSNTAYKYVTLAVTGTSEQSGNLIARFYVKTKDGQYHYADYIKGSNQTYSGMAFDLSAVSANLG